MDRSALRPRIAKQHGTRFESHLPTVGTPSSTMPGANPSHCAIAPYGPRHPCWWAGFERAECRGAPSRRSGTARLHRGMSLAQTPPGLPLNKAIVRAGPACRGQPAGSTLPAKVRQAARRCPRERVRLVHVWSTRHRNPAVHNGLQRSPAVDRSPRSQGAILGKQDRGQNPDKDEAGGSSPPRPTTAIDQHKRWSACPEPVGLAGYRTKNAYLVTVPGHQARSATPASCLVCKLAATAPHKRATATTAENPVSPA